MTKEGKIQYYCTGCGLCGSVLKAQMINDEYGFYKPKYIESEHIYFYENVCPAIKGTSNVISDSGICGQYYLAWLGYAIDSEIRFKGSSGGTLTAISGYLLDRDIVDAVIQTSADKNIPYETATVLSRTKEELLNNSGSRYSISSPLKDIKNMLKPEERYALVGKPCDIFAIKQYIKEYGDLKENIVITLSFFCAGIPSVKANKQLIRELTGDESNCSELLYRGRGWPGEAIAIDNRGHEYKMSYEYSWGKILGRDTNRYCEFCTDGMGEFADISCGDAWYLDENNKPDFGERDGRNVIMARSELGKNIIIDALKTKYIIAEEFKETDDLKYIQPYQWRRKGTMLYKTAAMKLMFRTVPNFNYTTLRKWQQNELLPEKIRIFLGTIKRCLKGKYREKKS